MKDWQDIATEIVIVSGEGEQGTIERYTGKRTMRAIKSRLTRERSHGDRWARAVAYSHCNEHGPVGIDIVTGECCSWHPATQPPASIVGGQRVGHIMASHGFLRAFHGSTQIGSISGEVDDEARAEFVGRMCNQVSDALGGIAVWEFFGGIHADTDKAVRGYLSAIGAKGGATRTPAKADAARANGRKGGRPKKDAPPLHSA